MGLGGVSDVYLVSMAVAPFSATFIADAAAWTSNVSSAVLIIFVNKVLMSTTGYGFRFGAPHGTTTIQIPLSGMLGHMHTRLPCRLPIPSCTPPPASLPPQLTRRRAAAATTLCALHYLACSLSVYASQRLGYLKKADLPIQGKPAHSGPRMS